MAFAEWAKVVVKSGDQLGRLVQEVGINPPLWGKNGLVALVLKNNPQIKNANKIFPGDIVFLPKKVQESRTTKIAKILPEKRTPLNSEMSNRSPQQKLRDWKIEVGTGLSLWQRNLKFNSTTGTLNSKVIPSLLLEFDVPTSENWNFFTDVTLNKVSFNESEQRSLAQDSDYFFELLMGMSRSGAKWNYSGGLSIETTPFVAEATPTSVELESYTLLSPYLEIQREAFTYNKTAFSLGLGLKYQLPSSGETADFDGGYQLRVFSEIQNNFKPQKTFKLVPYLSYANASTDFVDHTELMAGINFFYGFDL